MSPAQPDAVVLSRRQDAVQIISFNRPARLNAWTPELGERFSAALHDAAEDPQVRAIVVTGEGRAFSAGADRDAIAENSQRIAAGQPSVDADPWTLLQIPKPVIAAVNGPCVGLGLGFALMCDVRFASTEASFAAPFSRLGLVAEDGLSWLLPRLVGLGNGLDLLLSGRTVAADEAAAMGLVNRVTAAEDLLTEALDYAGELAVRCSPRAMASIKQQVYGHLDADLPTAIRESAELTRRALHSADVHEGMSALAQRRIPAFDPLGAAGTDTGPEPRVP